MQARLDNERRPGEEPGLWPVVCRGVAIGALLGGSMTMIFSLGAVLFGHYLLDCSLLGLCLLLVGFLGVSVTF